MKYFPTIGMRVIKRSHKALMIFEAGYIYCKRRGIDHTTFIDNMFLKDDFDSSENSEFDNICKDLRMFRYYDNYKLKELTEVEYEDCVDEFGINE